MYSDGKTCEEIQRELVTWIASERFTCLAARAAVMRHMLRSEVYPAMGSLIDTTKLHTDICEFVATDLSDDSDFWSFVAIFRGPLDLSEAQFETALWEQLAALHSLDAPRYPWAPGYSAEPTSSEFGFSLAGHPFFVAGLNPAASRISRRFRYPALVWNSHLQFERLKSSGVYFGLQHRIRARELSLQGSLNPMLSDHGESSEAPQYSGRALDADWSCPLRPIGAPGRKQDQ